MTEIFTEEAPELIGVGAEAIVQNATRLGLTWVLRYGTVVTSDPLTVTVDSDSVAVAMVSLIGTLAPDTRVSVLIVSSKVHFVIGFPPGEASRKNMISMTLAAATADLTLTGTATVASGTEITVTSPICTYEAEAVFDMRCITFSSLTTGLGELYVDGVAATGIGVFVFTAVNTRATVAQQWTGALTAGSHDFELRGSISPVVGTERFIATHTNLKVKLWG